LTETRGGSGCRPTAAVIEDDTAVARMLRLCLREAGFDTAEASTGGEVLRLLHYVTRQDITLDKFTSAAI